MPPLLPSDLNRLLQLTTSPVIGIMSLYMLIGVGMCFWGYRLFRIFCALVGLLTGGIFGYVLGESLSHTPFGNIGDTILLTILFAGVIGGICFFSYYVIVFLTGLEGGFKLVFIVLVLTKTPPGNNALLLFLIVGMAVGMLALWLQKHWIILITAFNGAAILAAGGMVIFLKIYPSFYALENKETSSPDLTPLFISLAGILCLGITGMIIQYISTGKSVVAIGSSKASSTAALSSSPGTDGYSALVIPSMMRQPSDLNLPRSPEMD